MIFKKKQNEIFAFVSEASFRDYCAENKGLDVKSFSDINVNFFNTQKRIEKIDMNKLLASKNR